MQCEAQAIVSVVVEAAKAGDMTAARIILDRLAPPRRDRYVEVDMPPILTAKDAVEAAAAVIEAVAAGELTPSEGEAISALIDRLVRAIEIADLEERVQRLEIRASR